jgi:hypothetical protein
VCSPDARRSIVRREFLAYFYALDSGAGFLFPF